MKSREYVFDLLRVIAICAVVLIHTTAIYWYDMEVTDYKWMILNILDMFAHYAVPIFFMISGRFFLDPEKSISYRKLYLKYILRLVTAFIFWSAFYTLFNIYNMILANQNPLSDVKWLIIEFFKGEYHMWFIYVMIGLYIIVPLLRKITADKKTTEYFLLLFLFFQVFLANAAYLPKVGVIIRNALDSTVFTMTMGYSGYFVLGYYLWRFQFSKKKEFALYFLGVIGIAVTCIGGTVYSILLQTPNEDFSGYFNPNMVLGCIAIYLFFIRSKRLSNLNKLKNITLLEKLSGYSFGIYLIHPVVIWIFLKLNVTSLLNEVIMVPIITVLVTVISVFFVSIIKSVKLGKYIC